jgi:glycosyltransferase involved in cell wall biosynthesis
MKFWVTTPSFNQVEWLKLCVASVADQAGDGVEVHHHVQDACSTDGTVDFLKNHSESREHIQNYSFSYLSEKDEGMYDAINKGWGKSCREWDVMSHLNCDEQYLEHGLRRIMDVFVKHPLSEVVFANLLILDGEGRYICHRRGLKPHRWLLPHETPSPTAVTFFRASLYFERKCRYGKEWKAVGDKVWFNLLHSLNPKYEIYKNPTSVYTMLESNLSNSDTARQETQIYRNEIKGSTPLSAGIVRKINLMRRMIVDLYHKIPEEYAIYKNEAEHRTVFKIAKSTSVWGRK